MPTSALQRLKARISLTLRAAWQGLVGFYRSDDLVHASSIAYFALLSLFPLLLLALGVLGSATASDADRTAVLGFIAHFLPGQFQFINGQLDALRGASWSLGAAGTLLTLWAALGVFDAITAAVNHAWGVARPHGFLRHKLVSLVMMAAAGLLLVGVLLLVSMNGLMRSAWFTDALGTQPGLPGGYPLLQWLMDAASGWWATALFVVLVGLVFYFVPNTRVHFREVWPGAVLTGLLWHGALAGFAWFLGDLGRFSVHGSIAAVVAFLVWVYLQAAIVLYGVEFTAAYARLRAAASRPVGGVTATGGLP